MKNYSIPEISENVFAVGSRDWDLKLFDALIPTPYGTSYNSYLIKGSEKTALIETVKPCFQDELGDKLKQLLGEGEIDYLVMNHAEPDHAGAIPYIMELSAHTRLVTSEKGAKMAEVMYKVPSERIVKVKEGDTIELGGKTLKFIDAPWLHWPETMFTYLIEDKILFPCDFFGSHFAKGVYDTDIKDIITGAQKYYGEIMMPFRALGKKAMDKLENVEISMIAPSHGPVYKNPEKIISVYKKWTAGETDEKAIVAYVSMWGSTEKMAKAVAEKLMSEGIEVSLYNLTATDAGDVAKDLVDSRAIVIGSPTVMAGIHPLALYAASLVRAFRPPLKYAAVVGSYGWGGCSVKEVTKMLELAKVEVVGSHEVNGPPLNGDYAKLEELGKVLACRIRQG
ncbi:MAG: FprA family A-type flavoprotein [Candidatus Schekmanbacteria bacterium]|nr:MAG: FprA family A-type flavoprotein [Candidatus Schekmanbacteria bacterium]